MKKVTSSVILAWIIVVLAFSIPTQQFVYAQQIDALSLYQNFSASLVLGGNGWKVMGYLLPPESDVPTTTPPSISPSSIIPYYSLDGKTYVPQGFGQENEFQNDWTDGGTIPTQSVCFQQNQQPLQDFLEGKLHSFWVKLRILSDGHEYFSNAVQIQRATDVQPLPTNITVVPRLDKSMRINPHSSTYRYCVTTRVNSSPKELGAVLPGTLLVENQFSEELLTYLGSESVSYGVNWHLPDEPWQEAGSVSLAATTTPPTTHTAILAHGIYSYAPPTIPSHMPLSLVITVMDAEQKATPLFTEKKMDPSTGMGFSLDPKPTGATSIIGEYSLDNGATWLAVGGDTPVDATARYPVDGSPKDASYTAYTYFSRDDSPAKDYLSGEISGFLFRLRIQGGVFHGTGNAVPWPSDYVYQAPPLTGGDQGSGGNRGDVGSNNNDHSDGDSGERPKPEHTTDRADEWAQATKEETDQAEETADDPEGIRPFPQWSKATFFSALEKFGKLLATTEIPRTIPVAEDDQSETTIQTRPPAATRSESDDSRVTAIPSTQAVHTVITSPNSLVIPTTEDQDPVAHTTPTNPSTPPVVRHTAEQKSLSAPAIATALGIAAVGGAILLLGTMGTVPGIRLRFGTWIQKILRFFRRP